jgi:hypothetical protein
VAEVLSGGSLGIVKLPLAEGNFTLNAGVGFE